jgi:hypothetical protein
LLFLLLVRFLSFLDSGEMPANAMRPEAIHLQKANRQQQKYFFSSRRYAANDDPHLQPLRARVEHTTAPA